MQGLQSKEVLEKLKIHGYNELPSSKSKSIARIALEVFREPMFVLLIFCGAIYMLIGDYQEGGILLSTILLIIFITFYQYQKTEKSLDALRRLSSPRALVRRDGLEMRIPARELVPEDIIILNEGDRIAADARVLEAINLEVDEALLTGESVPTAKSVKSDVADRNGILYSGTLVVKGRGLAQVIATGTKTEFGKIGTSLENIKSDQTRLQSEMKWLVKRLFIAGGILSVGTVVVFYFTRGGFIQSLLNGLAAAMSILPEEFPVVLTVFLALGAWRLSKRNVLTRNPTAIESLGSATVLCSDKTGTITQNKMEVAILYNGMEQIKNENVQLSTPAFDELLKASYFASQPEATDPMEKAIAQLYFTHFASKSENYILLKEYPLSPDLLVMTRILERDEKDIFISSKGAPEAILELCKLSEQEKIKHLGVARILADQGLRVLGIAQGRDVNHQLPDSQRDLHLTFLGLIGLHDPVRPEVPAAIQECMEAGIKVIMITGDFPATARSIAGQIGLDANMGVITGEELGILSDEQLRIKIVNTNIFARVRPEQKLRIVQALKANNEVVAMTGDGVNDAPALKAAHIGIAMGNKGTDVAREASSLVLLDDNFASIVLAIRSGRRIFDNLQKAMSYIIAIHIPIIGLTLLPGFITSLPILLMPLHIVFMELIIDPICSVAFESEQEERNIMKRPPRNPEVQFFGRDKLLSSALRGLLVLIVVVAVYFLSINEGHDDGEVRAITFVSLIVGNIVLIVTSLSKSRSFIAVFLERNLAAILILSAASVVLFLIISLPVLRNIFSFNFPGYWHFVPSLAGAVFILLVLETLKYLNYKRQ